MLARDVTGDKRSVVSRRPAVAVALLSVLTTNQKGLIAETAIVAECVRLDVGVCQPLGPERYDLIIDLRPRLLRVQCKWANLYGDVVIARLYSNRRGPNGMIRRLYTADEVDGFAVYCGELRRSFYLPADDVPGSAVQLRLHPTRNNQSLRVRWAKDYEFAARLMSLLGP